MRWQNWRSDQLIFLDKSAACEYTDDRKYKWSLVSHEAAVHSLFYCLKRWSLLSAYTTEDYITYEIHHDFITQIIFNKFVRNKMLSLCTSYTDRESWLILILNNTSCHMLVKLNKMCEAAEVLVKCLSLYSCDYNLIEIFFILLKRWIHYHAQSAEAYKDRDNFKRFLWHAVKT